MATTHDAKTLAKAIKSEGNPHVSFDSLLTAL